MHQYKLDGIKLQVKRLLVKSLSEHNIKLENISLKKDANGFLKINLLASEVKDQLTLGERLYIENAQEYNCDPSWLYKRAKLAGKAYEIVSWNPNSYRYPIAVKEVYSLEIKKITTKKLISLFSKGYLMDRKFRSPYSR